MQTFIDPYFWLNFFYFIFAIFITFFIPGNLFIKNVRLSFFTIFILSLITGMVLWAWQGFIFGYLGLRSLTYLYLGITFFLWLKFNWDNLQNLSFRKIPKLEHTFLAIVLLCTSLQLLTTLFLGITYKDGIYFCCSLPDSLYHLSLTSQIVKQIPPIEPGASGILVSNYHYLSNLVVAELVRVFHLPLMATQYQYSVLLLSLLYGLSAIVFAQIIKVDKKYIYWLTFFLYFSGDLTFLLLFILGKGLNFSLPFLENAAWLWISPPRVFASVIFFAGLSLLSIWIKSRKLLAGITMALVFGSLIGFKVYVGIFALSGLTFLSIYHLWKKNYSMLLPPVLTLFLSLLLYLPINKSSGGLIFTGIWRFENFIVSPQLGLSHLELARQIYYSHNNWPRLIEYTIIYIGIYFIFIFGTIILGLLQTRKSLAILGREVNIFLISGILVSLILGSFFIQRTGGANSSQFLITVDIIASVYAALACFYWTGKIRNNLLKTIVILIIIIFTVPRVTYIAQQSIKSQVNRQGFFIDNREIEALNFLKNASSPQSVILVDNINKAHWRNAFSHYIGALSERQLFLDGEGITLDHGVNLQTKLKAAETIFSSSDPNLVRHTLLQNHIDYLYMLSSDKLIATDAAKFLNPVFKNEKVQILQVKNTN